MNKIKLAIPVFVLQISVLLYGAENNTNTDNDTITLVAVMIISLLIWLAVAAYVFFLNKKVSALEKKLNEK